MMYKLYNYSTLIAAAVSLIILVMSNYEEKRQENGDENTPPRKRSNYGNHYHDKANKTFYLQPLIKI